jgi:hypothetical protein
LLQQHTLLVVKLHHLLLVLLIALLLFLPGNLIQHQQQQLQVLQPYLNGNEVLDPLVLLWWVLLQVLGHY